MPDTTLDLTRYEGHTEGPWVYEWKKDGYTFIYHPVGVARVAQVFHGVMPEFSHVPNTRLIADAPLLLAKLREAVGIIRKLKQEFSMELLDKTVIWKPDSIFDADKFLSTIKTGDSDA